MSDSAIKEKKKVIEKNKVRRAVQQQPVMEKHEVELVKSVVEAYYEAFIHLPPFKFRILRRQQSLEKFPWVRKLFVLKLSIAPQIFIFDAVLRFALCHF